MGTVQRSDSALPYMVPARIGGNCDLREAVNWSSARSGLCTDADAGHPLLESCFPAGYHHTATHVTADRYSIPRASGKIVCQCIPQHAATIQRTLLSCVLASA
jgi:hypothetical protein